MAPEAQARERYASAVGELWSGLAGTLVRLEALAQDPGAIAAVTGRTGELRRLQLGLHRASEVTVGLAPPAAACVVHEELQAALIDARDATGAFADAIDERGEEALQTGIWEWRGALFRVRLARNRLRTAEVPPAAEPRAYGIAGPACALVLSLGGVLAFLAGAILGQWPLWALGAAALCASPLVYRS